MPSHEHPLTALQGDCSESANASAAIQDFGPLAWVLEALRKSTDGAIRQLRRYALESQVAPGTELLAVDVTCLQAAKQQMHQVYSALQMVEMPSEAAIALGMEQVLQYLVRKPEACTESALQVMERAGFALMEYLDMTLAGEGGAASALFPQYRDVLALVGSDKAHPADLWPTRAHWPIPPLAVAMPPLGYSAKTRAMLEQAVLTMVKSASAESAGALRDICLGLAHSGLPDAQLRFWRVAAGCFDAAAHGLLVPDIYLKRIASRVLTQYAQFSKGDGAAPDRLLHDMLFFCAQAGGRQPMPAALHAVHAAMGLGFHEPVDYARPRFGRFDPALVGQARKRLVAATETWSAFVAGDLGQRKAVVDQFGVLIEAMQRLLPASADLLQTITRVVQGAAERSEVPQASMAMEVATTMLYLQSVLETRHLRESDLSAHGEILAARLQHVSQGQQALPLEPWMEVLYRKASDAQSLGSVVGELREALAETEKLLDQFFRQPSDVSVLSPVFAELSQMRSVLSVLGVDQAAHAMLRMRELVEQLQHQGMEPLEQASAFERLGNSLSALGFLMDMLSYQPSMARKLFVYDEAMGELRPVMGRAAASKDAVQTQHQSSRSHDSAPHLPAFFAGESNSATSLSEVVASDVDVIPPIAVAAGDWGRAGYAGAASEAQDVRESEAQDTDDELLDIFLCEAREVIRNGCAALQHLAQQPDQWSEQIALRRAFHTLKGSARMVQLNELGEAAWAFEAMLNDWLAAQQPMPQEMQTLSQQALWTFAAWVEAIAQHAADGWNAAALRTSADAMRMHAQFVPLATAHFFNVEQGARLEAAHAVPHIDTATGNTRESESIDGNSVQVGELHIPRQLFDVFLGEADAGSQQLKDALQAWAHVPDAAPPADAVMLAHNLAGSSVAVGFDGLSALARTLEAALLQIERESMPVAAEVPPILLAAAEDMRRLLHQFAAGFLRTPMPAVMQALRMLLGQNAREESAAVEGELHAPVSQASYETGPADEVHAEIPVLTDAVEFPVAEAADHSEDIDVVDVIDPDLFPIFEEEAVELLPTMGAALRQWASDPLKLEARNAALRALHTLKGSARLAGAMRLGEMAHRLESQLEPLEPALVSSADTESLLLRVDSMQTSFEQLRAQAALTPDAALEGQGSASPLAIDAPSGATAAQTQALTSGSLGEGVGPRSVPLPQAGAGLARTTAGQRRPAPQTVRVRSQLLDKLINEAGEVMIARSRLDARMGVVKGALADLGGNLERLRHQLRDLEVQAESQMQSRMAYSKEAGADFDPLEFDRFTRVQELTRMMAESVNDVATVQRHLQREVVGAEDDLVAQGRQARDLQRDLLRTRMVEFDSVAERLYAVVRGAAKETGKQVKLDIAGGTIEMDRGVLERMAPAFAHLLRNGVGHGIELPGERMAAGKPAQGTITVQVQQEGNDVAVAIRDDGAGLNVERIQEKALALGWLKDGEVVDSAKAAELVLMPGFTTANVVTELSGRGMGMDVVRSEVQALGGRIETSTERGQGTTFRMVLPLTTAVTQVSMLRMGNFTVGLPANLVESVQRLNHEELQAAYRSGVWAQEGVTLPFYWGGAVWQQSTHSTEPDESRTQPVLIVRSAAQRIALHVDELLGLQEVVVKHLGPQMARLPGLTGMSVLPSGAVVLIYNPVALTSVYAERIRDWGQKAPQTGDASRQGGSAGHSSEGGVSGPPVPLVMVVDDSITVRRVTQRLLQREGYRVVTAPDGLQALEKLQGELPCVVLSDIEMPQMDGFDLTRQIRADSRLQHLPLVMITSRTADKHRAHAMALGANHYLGKPYRDEELMQLVHHYAGQSQSKSHSQSQSQAPALPHEVVEPGLV